MAEGTKLSIVPTLLVGLGGVGSKVVEKVFDNLPEDRREEVAIHAFDTDVNDIAKKELLKGRITQISEPLTVGDYLRRADDSVQDWFPGEVHEIQRKTLTDGAGQIRSVSRLAYRAAMQYSKLDDFKTQINSLLKAKGTASRGSIRVMIVSSLAGGTGSGIFLQTALYLRDLLHRQYQQQAVLVRGAFLLPDSLVHTKIIPSDQINNVRSNAYACLKELDAITRHANNQLRGGADIRLAFEYRPDQVDGQNRLENILLGKDLPYDFCFFYDFHTDQGHNLGQNYDNYLEQMSKSIFHQLFSPMEAGVNSTEDNHILQLIEGQGANRYCSSGTGSLIYPYPDLVEYFALRWTEQSLSSEWRKLDEEFEEELRQFEHDFNTGVYREPPEIGKRYMALFEQYASGREPHPFFRNLLQTTKVLDDKEKEIGTKAEEFIKALEDKMKEVLSNDQDLVDREQACQQMDEGKLKNKETAADQVIQMEDNLDTYEKQIRKSVYDLRNFIMNQAVGEECRSSDREGREAFKMSSWMLKSPNPLHPVAVRYVLYQIREILQEKIGKLQLENKKRKHSIEQYDLKFDDPETKEFIEKAEDRVRQALEQPVYKRILRNEFKSFVNDYLYESQQQLQRLNQYKIDHLKEVVFKELHEITTMMLEDWEQLFRNMQTVQNKLRSEIAKRAYEHEKTSDPTRRYVLADKQDKERTWARIRTFLAPGHKLPESISEHIYRAQYQQFCMKYQTRFGMAEYRQMPKLEEVFRQHVLKWCRGQIQELSEINLNVVEAVNEEAKLDGRDPEAYRRERIEQVDRLARPCIMTNAHNPASKAWWGGNPETLEALSEQNRDALFGNEMVADEAFSPFELIRYRIIYGLAAEHFPAFSAGSGPAATHPGEYYRSYRIALDKIHDPEIDMVTPHLDKRWHLPAYMPDLNQEVVKADLLKTQKTFVWGLALGRLVMECPDGRTVWEVPTSSGRCRLTIEGREVPGRLYDCYLALLYNPKQVDSILAYGRTMKEQDRKKTNLAEHAFIRGCHLPPIEQQPTHNIIDCLLTIYREAHGGENLLEDAEKFLRLVMDEITDYYLQFLGERQENRAKEEAGLLIADLIEKSKYYQEEKSKATYNYSRLKSLITDHFKDRLGQETVYHPAI